MEPKKTLQPSKGHLLEAVARPTQLLGAVDQRGAIDELTNAELDDIADIVVRLAGYAKKLGATSDDAIIERLGVQGDYLALSGVRIRSRSITTIHRIVEALDP